MKWQGIGAAVDAHLARLGQANRGIAIARKINDDHDVSARTLAQHAGNEWGWRWALFGASYGHVGADGKPVIEVGISRRPDDQRPGAVHCRGSSDQQRRPPRRP